jgi:hypothetical protein
MNGQSNRLNLILMSVILYFVALLQIPQRLRLNACRFL